MAHLFDEADSVKTVMSGPSRWISCPRPKCWWRAQLPRRNALVTAARLKALLRAHLKQLHPSGQ